MTWASILKSLASLASAIMTWLNNKRQQELGAKEAKIEGLEHAEKVSADIADARADTELRKSVRERYTRDDL